MRSEKIDFGILPSTFVYEPFWTPLHFSIASLWPLKFLKIINSPFFFQLHAIDDLPITMNLKTKMEKQNGQKKKRFSHISFPVSQPLRQCLDIYKLSIRKKEYKLKKMSNMNCNEDTIFYSFLWLNNWISWIYT